MYVSVVAFIRVSLLFESFIQDSLTYYTEPLEAHGVNTAMCMEGGEKHLLMELNFGLHVKINRTQRNTLSAGTLTSSSTQK